MSDTQEKFYVSPIANPLCSEKLNDKVLKITKKFIAKKQLKRGVKEVVKSIRKGAKGVVVMAADISPVDVLSHIPIQCEKKGIPYAYVKSRMELGAAAETKKPTSIVLLLEPNASSKLYEKYESLKTKFTEINPYLV